MRYIGAISDPTIGVAALSDAGRSGKNNEDDYVAFETRVSDEEGIAGEVPVQVLMVADGIGGNVAGEMASHLAAQTFHDTFTRTSRQRVRQRLIESIDAANQAIYQKTLEQPELQGMGTTLVAAALVRDKLYVAHAGDSRAYVIRNGKAYQLTLDHTWAQEAIEAGRLTPAQAREHPNRHVIKRFLGIAPTVDIDPSLIDINRGPLDPEQSQAWPKSDQLQLQPGDTLFLCSDGLTDVVTDKQIEQTVAHNSPQDAVRKLVDMANSAGGPDNITVLILQRRQPGAPVVRSNKRSPLLATLVGVALMAMVIVAWVLLGNQGDGTAVANADATTTAVANIAVAVAPATETATATLAPTETEVPATATASATAISTTTPTPTATQAESTSTPVPDPQNETDAPAVDQAALEAANGLANSADGIMSDLSHEITSTNTLTATTTSPRAPTSTPIPEPSITPTATETPTAAVTPTATRVQLAAQVATSTRAAVQATATEPNNSLTVNLTNPANGERGQGRQRFAWQHTIQLQPQQAFEVIFWQKGQDPFTASFGITGAMPVDEVTVDLNELYNTGKLERGEYQWSVLLVEINPYKRLQLLSSGRQFFFEPSDGGTSKDDIDGNKER